ncbi:hypothetical protein [Nocardia coffeae]|nr:hypothetical protein [Nocardia coffeae]
MTESLPESHLAAEPAEELGMVNRVVARPNSPTLSTNSPAISR